MISRAYSQAAFCVAAILSFAHVARAAGTYHEVTYPASDKPGELVMGVTYTVWIPDGVEKIRGVIVHQHGCGTGACKGGATAAYDLHWQALAKKWNCALLGPSYQQAEMQNCRLWCDPRNGSAKTFLKALADLGQKSKHPELAEAPWCLWGHSGGGFWASILQTLYPERVVAIWFRSGTAFSAWEKGEVPPPGITQAVLDVPMMLNPGAKENGDKRFNGAWTGSMAMFKAYRAKGAPIGFAADPRTAHECGDSRYLAIPFFDACLSLRLSDNAGQPLKKIDPNGGFRADLLSEQAVAAMKYSGNKVESVWLPNESFAKAFSEYLKVGSVSDSTPPPAPVGLKLQRTKDGAILTWDSEADFESGLKGFVIERDGKEIGQLPEKAVGRFGRPLFQAMSYHDTPEQPLPALRFVDANATDSRPVYRVIAVNSVGLRSTAAEVK